MRRPELIEFNEFGKVTKHTRGYLDGCFDLCHAGHYNAVRQAASLTDNLVFGLNSDAEILANKGPPVMNGEERMKLVRACKWVKESQPDTPYTVTEKVLEQYECDFYLHGDDPCINSDGIDICQELSKIGKFKVFKRTSGVSTTGLTGKLLRLFDSPEEKKLRSRDIPKQQFLQTSSKIAYFSN